MIKKILLILVVLIVAAFIGLHIFVSNFDADRYRPMVIDELQKSLGKPVKLGHINLVLQGSSLVFELKELTILESEASDVEPVFKAKSVSALVQLMPLLSKQLHITAFSLNEPDIRITRDPQGKINIIGVAPVAAPVVASQDSELQKSLPLALYVSSLDILNGRLQFIDETTQPPTQIYAKSLSLHVQDMFPGKPMNVKITTAITLDADQLTFNGNLAVKAQVKMPEDTRAIPTETSWKVHSLDLSDGELHWTNTATKPPMVTVISKLRIQGKDITPGNPMDLTITGSLTESEPNFEIKARVVTPTNVASGSVEKLELTLKEVPLDRLLPPAPQDGVRLRGILSAAIDLSVPSLDADRIVQASFGSGTISIDQPVVENLNILREVFSKLSMIPGLMQRLESRLPEDYKAKLEDNDTLLNPIEISAVMERGVLKSDAINVSSDAFELSTAGVIGLNGTIDIRGTFSIDAVLSDAIIRSVDELRGLSNEQGRLQFPIAITGTVPNVAVTPDLDYIASKVLTSAAINLIDQFLNRDKKEELPQETPLTPNELTDAPLPPTISQGDLFGDILRRVIEKNLPAD